MRDIDRYSTDYLNSNDFEVYQVKYRRRKVLEYLSKAVHHNVLEIGCGMEPLFKYIAEDKFDKWVTVEPSKLFYDNAYGIAKGFKKIELINDFLEGGNVSKIIVDTFKGKPDVVICTGLLHEVEKPEVLLKAIRTVCDENTEVVLNVPNALSFHRILAVRSGIIKDEHTMSKQNIKLQQHNVFDIKSLTNLVEINGFKVIKSGSFFVKPFTHEQMQKCINAGILNEKILDGFYNMSNVLPEYGSELFAVCQIKK